jgi:hypothetical protein
LAVALWAVVHRPVPQRDHARHVLVGEASAVLTWVSAEQARRIVLVERGRTRVVAPGDVVRCRWSLYRITRRRAYARKAGRPDRH